MEATPWNQAISALRVAPIESIGTVGSWVFFLVLVTGESKWSDPVFCLAVIATLMLYRASPSIQLAAKLRASRIEAIRRCAK